MTASVGNKARWHGWQALALLHRQQVLRAATRRFQTGDKLPPGTRRLVAASPDPRQFFEILAGKQCHGAW
jgi:hypothetical protein